MVLPSDPRVFAAAGLGEATVTGVQLDKSSPGRIKITATRELQLAGVCLASDEVELVGEFRTPIVRARDIYEAVRVSTGPSTSST